MSSYAFIDDKNSYCILRLCRMNIFQKGIFPVVIEDNISNCTKHSLSHIFRNSSFEEALKKAEEEYKFLVEKKLDSYLSETLPLISNLFRAKYFNQSFALERKNYNHKNYVYDKINSYSINPSVFNSEIDLISIFPDFVIQENLVRWWNDKDDALEFRFFSKDSALAFFHEATHVYRDSLLQNYLLRKSLNENNENIKGLLNNLNNIIYFASIPDKTGHSIELKTYDDWPIFTIHTKNGFPGSDLYFHISPENIKKDISLIFKSMPDLSYDEFFIRAKQVINEEEALYSLIH